MPWQERCNYGPEVVWKFVWKFGWKFHRIAATERRCPKKSACVSHPAGGGAATIRCMRWATALRASCSLSPDPAAHSDNATNLFFLLALRENTAGEFTFHIPGCMKPQYANTRLGLVWEEEEELEVPYLELRGTIFERYTAPTRVIGARKLVPLLAHPTKLNHAFNAVLNWLYKVAKRQVAPSDSTTARPSIVGNTKFIASNGTEIWGKHLSRAMANPHLSPPANAPAWWTPQWWQAWATPVASSSESS